MPLHTHTHTHQIGPVAQLRGTTRAPHSASTRIPRAPGIPGTSPCRQRLCRLHYAAAWRAHCPRESPFVDRSAPDCTLSGPLTRHSGRQTVQQVVGCPAPPQAATSGIWACSTCSDYGGGGGIWWAANLVWEIWHFTLAAKFPIPNPGASCFVFRSPCALHASCPIPCSLLPPNFPHQIYHRQID